MVKYPGYGENTRIDGESIDKPRRISALNRLRFDPATEKIPPRRAGRVAARGGPSSWTCPIWPNPWRTRWITSPPSATAAPGNLPTGRQAGQRVLAGGIIHLRVTQESRSDPLGTLQPRTAALSRTGPRHHRGRPVCLSADNHVCESVGSNELHTIKPLGETFSK